MSQLGDLTDEAAARETALLEGVPYLNVGALFLPPIWARAWPVVDDPLVPPLAARRQPLLPGLLNSRACFRSPCAAIVGVPACGFTVVYAPLAALRSASGARKEARDQERYLEVERRWAVASVAVGVLLIAAATYYNLVIRPTVG